MIATTHAVVGGVIAVASPNLAVALPLAFVSHFFMDLIPHWDLGINFNNRPKAVSVVFSAIDVLIGAMAVYFVFGSNVQAFNLWLTVFFAQFPDWLEAPNLFFGSKFAPSVVIGKIQHRLHNQLDLPWGLVSQLFLILPLLTPSLPSVLAKP